jgi:Methyltransferase domain
MLPEALQRYLDDGFGSVQGWCSRAVVEISGDLVSYARTRGIGGGACEIGVFHGKFFIALANAVREDRSLAIDIFDDQSLNVDGSGAGFQGLQEAFRQNVTRYCARPDLVSEMPRDSLAIGPSDVLSIIERFSIFQVFSVDGGHTPEHVVNDYGIASQVTHPGGFIIVDDILNAAWPGVIEGIARLFLLGRPKFVPLCIGLNKLILTGLSYHKDYLRFVNQECFPSRSISHGTAKLFGHEVATFR